MRLAPTVAAPFLFFPREILMAAQLVAGVDVGHSAVKVVARLVSPRLNSDPEIVRSDSLSFPTACIRAVRLLDAAEQKAAALDSITLDGKDWFVGETAEIHGASPSFLDDDWIFRTEYAAMLTAAVRRVEISCGHTAADRTLVLGLPTRLEHHQRDPILKMAQSFLPGWSVRVLPQSKAPLHTILQTEDGRMKPGIDLARENWAVLDIGRYTTDTGAFISGRWAANASSSGPGTKVAEDHFLRLLAQRGLSATNVIAQRALLYKTLRRRGGELDVSREVETSLSAFQDLIVEYAERAFEPVLDIATGLILAGGGSFMLESAIRRCWRTVVMHPDPRLMIADGLCRFGLGAALVSGNSKR
jgi:plasmid segregation protein ParM